MNILFYAFALFFVVYEACILFYPKALYMVEMKLAQIMYMIWGIAGLFGSQWKIFVVLLVLSGITGVFKVTLGKKEEEIGYPITRIDAIASILLLVHLFMSYFHA